jgi:hypothetical protein
MEIGKGNRPLSTLGFDDDRAVGADQVGLVPELAALVPPAEVLDKRVYSSRVDTVSQSRLIERHRDMIVVTGRAGMPGKNFGPVILNDPSVPKSGAATPRLAPRALYRSLPAINGLVSFTS